MSAPTGNKFAEKPDSEKIAGKGRVVLDLGPLKARCVKAAGRRKLIDWAREVLDKACRDAGVD